jgi:hypothetical protein
MGTLKDTIKHKVCLFEPKSLDQYFSMERKVENKNMDTIRLATNNYREHHVPSPNFNQPKRLIAYKMNERRENELCFDCDRKCIC